MYDYTNKIIYLGIDVHRNSYSVTAICDGVIIKRDKILADPQTLLKYFNNFKGAHIKSAYEAGFSGFHLHRILITHGIDNIVVHPASIEVGSRDFVKTDKRDSLKIATQLAAGRLSCVYIPSEIQEDKRHLTRLREQFVRKKAATACQIKSLLYLHGLLEPFVRIRLSNTWLDNIIKEEMGKNTKFTLEKLAQAWKYFHIQINLINKQIAKEATTDNELELIYCSIPGIGPTSARKLINELGDMSHFSNQEKLFSYAGLTPREYSSGQHVRQGHISRQGKPIIRWVLVEAAWTAIKKDSSLKIIFEKLAYRAGKKRAIVAIARILLGRLKTCIKEKRLYEYSKQEIVKVA
ncbi:MAG TPA: IS110 family transposase [Cytophagales bacterium]|nr:IS110 family transposase [Cytophagales bacterium]